MIYRGSVSKLSIDIFSYIKLCLSFIKILKEVFIIYISGHPM